MVEMQGANIAELRVFAKAAEDGAQQIDDIRRWMTTIPRHVWKGADADAFLSQVDADLIVRLLQVVRALEGAATAVDRQADQQEAASAANPGSVGGAWAGAPGHPVPGGGLVGESGVGRSAFLRDVDTLTESALDGLDTGIDIAELAKLELPESLGPLDQFLTIRGLAEGSAEFSEGVQRGDIGLILNGGLKVGLEALGMTPFKPIAVVGGFAQSALEFSVPVGREQADSVIDSYCLREYGVSSDSLAPDQAESLSHRYDGIDGFANMVGDTWMKNTDELLNAGGGVLGAIGGFFGGGR